MTRRPVLVAAFAVLLAACGSTAASDGSGTARDARVADGADAGVPASPDAPSEPSGTPPADATPSPGASVSPTSDPEPEPGPLVVLRRDDEGFTDAEVAQLAALPGVEAVLGTRRDDRELTGSFAPDGTRLEAFPEGFHVEVSVLAAEGPERGTAWLTAAGASFRPVAVGGTLEFRGDGPALEVVRVLDEEPNLSRVEVWVHPDDGDLLGVEPRDRLGLRTAAGTDAEALAATARELLDLDPQRGTSVREPGAQRITLGTVDTKARFGELPFRDAEGRGVVVDPAWVAENIEARAIPPFGTVRCHRLVLDDLEAAIEDVAASGLAGWWRPSGLGGCFVPRRIGVGRGLSQHAYGIAFDANVDFDLPGAGPVPPDEVIAAFEANGFGWGGRFPTPDHHHWEWVGPPEG